MARDELGGFVRAYLQRVVNDRDVAAIDTLVSPSYRGSGGDWPVDEASLRAFYQRQARVRPDWHIEVQQTIEVGQWVAVRAVAGGSVAHDEVGAALSSPSRKAVEWLTLYRVVDRKIAEMQVIAVVEGGTT